MLAELSGRQVAASGFSDFQTRARLSTRPFCIASGRSHSLAFEASGQVLAEHLVDDISAGSFVGSLVAGRTDFARSEVCPCLQSATSQGCFEAAGSSMRSCSGFGSYLEVGSSARPEESFGLKAELTDTHFGSAGHLEAVLEVALVAESEALAVQSVVDIQSDIVAGQVALLVLVVPAVLAALADRIVAVLGCTDCSDSTEADLVDRTEPVVVESELAELVADCIDPDTGCIVAGSDCTEADFDYIVVDLAGCIEADLADCIEAEVHTFGLMADSTNFEGSEYSAECSSSELLDLAEALPALSLCQSADTVVHCSFEQQAVGMMLGLFVVLARTHQL